MTSTLASFNVRSDGELQNKLLSAFEMKLIVELRFFTLNFQIVNVGRWPFFVNYQINIIPHFLVFELSTDYSGYLKGRPSLGFGFLSISLSSCHDFIC